jgi:uncharacterized membrane protein
MRTLELKAVSPVAVFRLFGGSGMLIGAIVCIYLALEDKLEIPIFLNSLPFLGGTETVLRNIFLGGVTGILYGALLGLSLTASALIYNFLSSLFGGVDMKFDER